MQLTAQHANRALPLVNAYGNGGFTVNQQRYQGSVLLLPEGVMAWPVHSFAGLSYDSLLPLLESAPETEILMIGCGEQTQPLPANLKAALRAHGIAADCMDTGAACRTYNILQGEARKVAAALIAL